ncbi:EAL domain-containing protein [Geodermatophilus sp. YIM 151500]|uniref:putative bifunctional diguanylate cyclase/phosphodiesterase n=1 Tax=Geodermatophilus sp. YIM 151500 TaxID=2984531 RepID=UPI0021E4B7BF|nr:EAL domain-containing protein [Geodermatophilus sp. YIM 151500]MCV2489583.1 EAL domain-containing protein [Geodermatophilus sp. YIM 151500]
MSAPTEQAPTPVRTGRGFRLTSRVFWDLAVYMVGLGLVVGLVFPPFATLLGVPGAVAHRPIFQAACLVAGFIVGAVNYALCRGVVGGRLAELGTHLRSVADVIARATRSGDWSGAVINRIRVDSDDQIGHTAQAFNDLLVAVEGRKELEDRLHTQAFYDQLTGLPNRALFMERLREVEARSDSCTPSAVLFLDLDNLKTVNDNLGHEAGDGLLRAVTERVVGCVRGEDTVARLSGDEFAVLLMGPGSDRAAAVVAERVLASLRAPVVIGSHLVRAGVSIGLATSETCAAIGISLLRAADMAMYVAKTSGKGRCEVFLPSHHTAALERDQLRADLHEALDAGQLVLHYQPIVDLGQREVAGFEALLRWQHPQRGLVPPLEFISLAEETGLIVPIGRWVLQEATSQAAAWQEHAPLGGLRISVNVSVRQFQHPDLLGDVAEALRSSGLRPELLTLEITESLFVQDTADTAHKLEELKRSGVRLALDDFGTGYSSLSYLRRFPIDTLKIDKSFIDGVATDSEACAVAAAIVQLGQTLRLEVVAEGLEDADQLETLSDLDCPLGQGYHFAKPLPASEARALLRPETAALQPA